MNKQLKLQKVLLNHSKIDIFDYIHLLYYKWHKINPDCGGPSVYFPDWIKSKKARTNHINKTDNKCF